MARCARIGARKLARVPVMRWGVVRSARVGGRGAPTEPFWTVWAVRPEGEVGTRDRAARTREWGARRYGSERVAREEGGGAGRWEVRRGLGCPGGSGGGGRRHDLGVSSAKVGGREVRSLEFLMITCQIWKFFRGPFWHLYILWREYAIPDFHECSLELSRKFPTSQKFQTSDLPTPNFGRAHPEVVPTSPSPARPSADPPTPLPGPPTRPPHARPARSRTP